MARVMDLAESITPHCACTCKLPGCASSPGRYSRKAGLTVHGTEAGYRNGCRCDACTRAEYQITEARFVRRNEQARIAASKHGQVWTGPDLETATRPDLTARQAALMLGRTIKAVKNMRVKCKADPRYINLVDTPVGARPRRTPTS